ncbi:MAG: hypothetical protein ACYTG2_15370 [Planctomycetota bacterium]|jgi:hypothetical protein
MMLPRVEDRGVVVFKVWQGVGYERRLAIAFVLIVAGLGLQIATGGFLAGLLPLLLGNVMLLVAGYDNRVDATGWDAGANWERVEPDKLDELIALDRRIRSWDRSALDVTSTSGAMLFLVVGGGLVALAVLTGGAGRVLALDALVLLLPHWVTGVRRILVRPKLITRVQALRDALEDCRERLADRSVHLLMLLGSGETRIPSDVKFKVDAPALGTDFLGLYGQVVINEVQGASYPYFYVVLVAKQGFGLEAAAAAYDPPPKLTCELKPEGAVEVLVLRQTTSKTGGYHTKPSAAARLLGEGLGVLAELEARRAT